MTGLDRAGTRLVPATSAHFRWARVGDDSVRSDDGLRLPPGGVESADVLDWLERTASAVSAAIDDRGAWLIVEADEVVGIISFKGPPRDGVAEIGYGVAECRRARGHATRASGDRRGRRRSRRFRAELTVASSVLCWLLMATNVRLPFPKRS